MCRVAVIGRIAAASVLAGLLHACGSDTPTRPTQPQPNTPTTPAAPIISSLELVGPRSIAPGEAVQYQLRGTLSDGTTTDLTSQVQWRSDDPDVLSVEASGRATGGRGGETTLAAFTGRTSSSTEVMVLPTGTFRLSVIALEGSTRPVDLRVDVVRGIGAGLADVTPVNGRYDLYGVAGEVDVRVSGSGYRESVQRVIVSEHTVITVQVVPSRPRTDVSGTYTLELEGDAGCQAALPNGLATRRYGAIVSQSGPEITVLLNGDDFGFFGRAQNVFRGRVDGASERIVFNVAGYSDSFYGYAYQRADVMENLGDSTYLYFSGTAVTSVSPTRLSGTLNGVIRHLRFQNAWNANVLHGCTSDEIRFVLAR